MKYLFFVLFVFSISINGISQVNKTDHKTFDPFALIYEHYYMFYPEKEGEEFEDLLSSRFVKLDNYKIPSIVCNGQYFTFKFMVDSYYSNTRYILTSPVSHYNSQLISFQAKSEKDNSLIHCYKSHYGVLLIYPNAIIILSDYPIEVCTEGIDNLISDLTE